MDSSPVSPVPPYFTKTSSSEWNSSDDLAGPLSEQEETHNYPPPLPPKPHGSSHADLSGIPTRPPEVPPRLSPNREPRNGSLSHATLRRWIETPPEHRLSSDASSKSGSSDQDRNDLSASESEERLPSPKPSNGDRIDSPVADVALPTTYFSVDNCMTDAYRAKYHKKPAVYVTDLRSEEHASSGDSDVEGKGLPVRDVKLPVPSRSKAETGN